jgi:hypothetical protein
MLKPPLHVRGDCNLGRFEVGAALQRSDQAGAFALRLPLRAMERMPLSLPSTTLRISDLQKGSVHEDDLSFVFPLLSPKPIGRLQ